jgi:LmbE family N-acetylglucosaminyl deacetylase
MIPDCTHIPLKRPHYWLRDNQLYFLASRRPQLTLTSTAASLWMKINGETCAGELEEMVPESPELLASWWHSGVIELAEPVFQKKRIKVLVVEPHMDDAMLSIGALMWERRHTHEFIVVSLVGISNFTSYQKIGRDYFNTSWISRLRKSESRLAMRLLGGRHESLSLYDAPLRYQPGDWNIDWFKRNRRSIAAFINLPPSEDGVKSAAELLTGLFMNTDAAGIWIPMGVGTSTDHQTTRNSCLMALAAAADKRNVPPVTIYQDVPYAMDFPWHTDRIVTALEAAGASPRPLKIDVTPLMPHKLRLVSVFASQFKMSHMGPRVEKTARLAAPRGAGYGEMVIEMNRMPGFIDCDDLNSGHEHILATSNRLARWGGHKRRTRRVTIICPLGVGLWREFITTLLANFPHAEIDIHLSSDAADETSRFASPRVHIHEVMPDGIAWLRRILQLVRAGTRPVVVLTGWRYHRWARFINSIRLPFIPLAAVSAAHLVIALNHGTARTKTTQYNPS